MRSELSRVERAQREIIESYLSERPVKLAALARDLGLTVISATLPAGISGEIRPSKEVTGKYEIRVNRHDAPVRQRFTVAHEIAHFLLHKDAIGSGIEDDALYRSNLSNFREAEANRLAAILLIPDKQLEIALSEAKLLGFDAKDLPNHLAKEFNVSEAAMKIRLGVA